MKSTTSNTLALLKQETGTEPIVLLRIDWNATTYYSSVPVTGLTTSISIINIENVTSRMREDSKSEVSTVSITLDDTSGDLKKKIDTEVAEGKRCYIYHVDKTSSLDDKMLIFYGRISGDIEWNEGTRTFSFSIENILEDSQEAGIELDLTMFPNMNKESVGKVVPLSFGEVIKVPCLKLDTPISGTFIETSKYLDGYVGREKNLTCSSERIIISNKENFPISGSSNSTFLIDVWDPKDGIPDYRIRFRVINEEKADYLHFWTAEGSVNDQRYIQAKNIALLENIKILSRETGEYQNDASVCWIDSTESILGMYVIYKDITTGPNIYLNKCTHQEGNRCHFIVPFRSDNSVFHLDPDENKMYLDDGSFLRCSFEPRTDWQMLISSPGIFYDLILKKQREVGEGYINGSEITNTSAGLSSNPYDKYSLPTGSKITCTGKSNLHIFNVKLPLNESGTANINDDAIFNVFYEKDNILKLLKASEEYRYQQITVTKNDKTYKLSCIRLVDEEDRDLFVSFKSANIPEGNCADIIKSILYNFYSSFAIDSTSFNFAETEVAKYPNNFMTDEVLPVLDICSNIAYQSRCNFYMRNQIAYLIFLPYTYPACAQIDINNIIYKSLILSFTSTEEIYTKIIANYVTDYSGYGEKEFIYTNNTGQFGLRIKEIDYKYYTNEKYVEESIKYWGERLSNSYKKIKCETSISNLYLEAGDVVNVDTPIISSGGRVTLSSYNVKDKKISLEIDLNCKTTGTITPPPPVTPVDPENPTVIDIGCFNIREFSHLKEYTLTQLRTTLNAKDILPKMQYLNSAMVYDGVQEGLLPWSIYSRIGTTEEQSRIENKEELCYANNETATYGKSILYGRPFRSERIKYTRVDHSMGTSTHGGAWVEGTVNEFAEDLEKHPGADSRAATYTGMEIRNDTIMWRYVYVPVTAERIAAGQFDNILDFPLDNMSEADLLTKGVEIFTQVWTPTGWSTQLFYLNSYFQDYSIKPVGSIEGVGSLDIDKGVVLNYGYEEELPLAKRPDDKDANLRRISRTGFSINTDIIKKNLRVTFKLDATSNNNKFSVYYGYEQPETWNDMLSLTKLKNLDDSDLVFPASLDQDLTIPERIYKDQDYIFIFFIVNQDFDNDFSSVTNVVLYDFNILVDGKKINLDTTEPIEEEEVVETKDKINVRNYTTTIIPQYSPVEKVQFVAKSDRFDAYWFVRPPHKTNQNPSDILVTIEELASVANETDSFGYAVDPNKGTCTIRIKSELTDVEPGDKFGTKEYLTYLDIGSYFVCVEFLSAGLMKGYADATAKYISGTTDDHAVSSTGEVNIYNGSSTITLNPLQPVMMSEGSKKQFTRTDGTKYWAFVVQPIKKRTPANKIIIVGNNTVPGGTFGVGYIPGYLFDGYDVKVKYRAYSLNGQLNLEVGDKLSTLYNSMYEDYILALKPVDKSEELDGYDFNVTQILSDNECMIEICDITTKSKNFKVFNPNIIYNNGSFPIAIRLLDGDGDITTYSEDMLSYQCTISFNKGITIRRNLTDEYTNSITVQLEDLLKAEYPHLLDNVYSEDGFFIYINSKDLTTTQEVTLKIDIPNYKIVYDTQKITYNQTNSIINLDDPQYYNDLRIFVETSFDYLLISNNTYNTILLGQPWYCTKRRLNGTYEENYPCYWRKVYYYNGTNVSYVYEKYVSGAFEVVDNNEEPYEEPDTEFREDRESAFRNGYAVLPWELLV